MQTRLAESIAWVAAWTTSFALAESGLVAPRFEAARELELETGTHRPEILDPGDGTFVLAVVEPGGARGPGQVKHRVHRFDASTFREVGEPFDITWTTEEFGEPADHRALLVNGELVIVYQSLILDESRGRPRPEGGAPAESRAREQSLLLARYSLAGEERYRGPIVAHVDKGGGDNFPDHTIAWAGSRLLVSTGTNGRKVKIREVDLEGNVLGVHEYEESLARGIPGNIGNGFLVDGEDVVLFSYSRFGETNALACVLFDEALAIRKAYPLDSSRRQQLFPTGSLRLGPFTLVAYVAGEEGSNRAPRPGTMSARLKILDPDLGTLDDFEVGSPGFAHVHPTAVAIGERLLVAWSSSVESMGGASGPISAPRVVVQEYRIVGFSSEWRKR